MPYFNKFIHVYGLNLNILWSSLKIWMPINFTIANFGHPVSKSWLRPLSSIFLSILSTFCAYLQTFPGKLSSWLPRQYLCSPVFTFPGKLHAITTLGEDDSSIYKTSPIITCYYYLSSTVWIRPQHICLSRENSACLW